MKVESEKEINVLENKIIQLPNDTRTIENITRRGMDNLISLDERFENGIIKEQREIVGSIYPENLTFDREHYRTARLNEAIRQIYLIEKELQEKKMAQVKKISTCALRRRERNALKTEMSF